MAAKKMGLGSKGMGLEALINNKLEDLKETGKDMGKTGVWEIEIDMIEPNRKQPRKYFDETALEELAASIKTYGMIQPVVVRKNGDYYEIIAGERRWRAAKIAGLKKIPAIERKWEDAEAFEAALVENLQREDLNPIEEAESYRRLQDEFSLSQEQISTKVGKSRSAITNSLRLLQLDSRVLNFVVENKLSSGHARTLLSITDKERQFELAEHVIEEELSVRATEALVKAELSQKEKSKNDKKELSENANQKAVEDELKTIFSTKVRISQMKNKGKIEITYYSQEDLDRLLTMMKRMEG
ncbi:ParB/RepB/Spo0J family partition protein [Anaerotignum propionicum]|jgi:ParB family chromosome partitioning protein|uniref:Chromosome partitioning protein, ParB family n=1 Tax=Anaerotignum propionicum DSM 1682 TaxID=991789 RepID=A0A110A6J5_ANAPI|nr:ParB/RepB/Spo0J family partition protein [Anaerotignum propionicum]AMJ39640.1 putative chromosome-partitioning protein ParB [Anaerotignum propionicum DSM 1682]SHE31343.1 chromosome partitioning protein, ParB family [[Clostridium] propionicum DSM 1682] [Anaerotignum propionicum DSM 1682]